MKKPYLKKIGNFSGYHVWYVNGYWIRKHLARGFPNYGSHRTFSFVPKNEFWIDFENSHKEARFIIINFLAFMRGLGKKKSEREAIRIAAKEEKRERHKLRWVKKLKRIRLKEKLLKKLHKKQILEDKSGRIKIWIVRGKIVRSLFDVDFNQGGHGFVYPFIPKNEIWIDDSLYKKETSFILIHELHERQLMAKGWKYDDVGITKTLRKKGDEKIYAHPSAEDIEFFCRHHPKSIKKTLLKEIKANEKTS